jgi:hypothetical protein
MAPPAVASADTPTADVPLDAMVTRMQRHAEALIALARAGEADADAEPGRIDDIIVAAATRVGASGRVRMRAETVPAIQAPFVETLRHLLVEVLDNAARFSPEDQPITVTVGLIRGGAMLQITDSGPGMTAADFAEATRVMTTGASPAGPHHQGPHIGLAVVARAATMLGAHVRISPVRSHRGTQVAIALPQAIFAASHPATLPRSMQAPPPTLGVAPRRTARHAQPVAEAPSGTVRAPEHLSRPSHRFEAPAARRTGSHRGRDDPWERDG